MNLQHPPFLKPGDTIGITCPSGYTAPDRVAYAVTVLQRWGFQVKVGKTVGSEHFYFSGTDEERLADLQAMLDDPGIHAVLMGRGGYGMSRIVDRIDFTSFRQHPKWICGFSDITLLHNHIQAVLNLPTLHSPMCGAFKPETEHADFLLSLKRAWEGAPLNYDTPACDYNRPGAAEGILTGGNLALLVHSTGSLSEVDTRGKILFIEDIGEHLYQVDRMLLHLKRAGKLAHLAGLVVGNFTDMEDTERPFGQTLEALIFDKVAEYDYPVCFHFPAGHEEINHTLCLGMPHQLTVTASGGHLSLVSSSGSEIAG
jgi:muramoyltetrapeptide carboxypeptidase